MKKHKKMLFIWKKYKDLKSWLQEHKVWEKELFNTLLAKEIYSPDDLKNKVNDVVFDEISRKVRVERLAVKKDDESRKRLDKLLTTFEKEWRKLSGHKKTSSLIVINKSNYPSLADTKTG